MSYQERDREGFGRIEYLRKAYRKTIYAIEQPTFSLRWNQLSRSWNEFCDRNKIEYAAFVTADNPGSKLLPHDENEDRLAGMRRRLQSDGVEYYYYSAVDPDGKWPVERGFVVLNVERAYIVRLAMMYGQNAFAEAKKNECLKLAWLI